MEYCDSIVLEVNGVALDDVIIELTEKSSNNLKVVNTMNRRRRGKGFKAGNDMFSLDLKVEPIEADGVPSWHSMKKSRTVFSIRRTKNNGEKPTTWGRCRISDISEGESDGDSTMSVSVLALDRDP